MAFSSPSEGDAPSPATFARQSFADGAQSRAVAAGVDGHSAPVVDDDGRVGDWQAFDEADVVERESLLDSDDAEAAGRTAKYMNTVALTDSDQRGANVGFETQYDHREHQHPMTPDWEHAQNEVVTSAALETMGVRHCRHIHNPEDGTVVGEAVFQPNYDADIVGKAHGLQTESTVSTEYADRVDADQLVDVLAANAVVGNVDTTPDNVAVGEDGAVVAFDYDFLDDLNSTKSLIRSKGNFDLTINAINDARSDAAGELSVSGDDIVHRAREIATSLKESGVDERITSVAGDIDSHFKQEHAGPIFNDNQQRLQSTIDALSFSLS